MMKYKRFLIIFLLFSISLLIVYFFLPNTGYLYGNYGKLIINELMANNTSSYIDMDNEYSDWIELYNGYNYDIDLEGYHLSDKEYETDLWEFPKIKIRAKSYLVIFASGKDKCINNECHTNFKLGRSGEVITLTDDAGTIISKVNYQGSKNDSSYGYNGRRYVYFEKSSPGEQNIGNGQVKPIGLNSEKISVNINEYMINNTRMLTDEDGEYSSFIELYNYGDKDVNLEGYFISDNKNKLDKYMFGDVVIKSKDYLIVYASGKNKDDNEIHTNFKLSKNDNYLAISSFLGNIIDEVDLVNLDDNVSYGRNNDGWCYYMYPSIGFENNTKCFKEY